MSTLRVPHALSQADRLPLARQRRSHLRVGQEGPGEEPGRSVLYRSLDVGARGRPDGQEVEGVDAG